MIWTGDNIHNFNIPNDHYRGVFNNISPIDMAHYWELPNKEESRRMYLQQINFDNYDSSGGVIIRAPENSVNEMLSKEGYFYNSKFKYYSALTGILAGLSLLTTAL